jgi:hypothetical protein
VPTQPVISTTASAATAAEVQLKMCCLNGLVFILIRADGQPPELPAYYARSRIPGKLCLRAQASQNA